MSLTLNLWILIFYAHGTYGPDVFSVIGRYNTHAVCQQMGQRIQMAIKPFGDGSYYCIEELK